MTAETPVASTATTIAPPQVPPPFSCSATVGKLFTALAKAQKGFPKIAKDKSAEIQMKSGGKYRYNYADLASMIDAVRVALADQGLSYFQPVATLSDGRIAVQTVLAHESGEWLATPDMVMPVSDKTDPKALASAITYARRYQLAPMIGVAPEDDDDGDAAGRKGAQAQARRERQPEARAEEPPPVAADPTDERPIVKAQLDRLRAVMREHKVDERLFGGYLKETYGYTKWGGVQRRHYDAIVALAQAGGAKLPVDEAPSA